MFDHTLSLECKTDVLKYIMDVEERLIEAESETSDIFRDPDVRAALPNLLCSTYTKQNMSHVLVLLDVLEKEIVQVRDDRESWFQKIFRSAVDYGHTKLVTKMLQLGGDVNSCSFGKPILHVAACNGHEDIVTELINEGADISLVDTRGDTVLHSVIKSELKNKLPMIRLLLSHGVDPCIKSSSGKSPLHVAVSNSPEVLELLLQEGQDVNIRESINNDTPLHVACALCCQDSIIKLLRYGAMMNTENKLGETPLAKLLKHTNNSNDFHSKTRIKLAKFLVSIGFRMKEKKRVVSHRAGASHKGRDKIFERYQEIRLSCKDVPSLQNISRVSVRENLVSGENVQNLMQELDIPTNLKFYLMYHDLNT